MGDENIIEDTRKRSRFFQTVHAWPLSNDIDFKGWIDNFKNQEEQIIASHILSFFTYYSKEMTNKLLRNVIGQAGNYFCQLSDWKHSDLINRCLYSYIPGERPNPTDSGHRYVTKVRDLLNVPEENIINYEDLPSILESLSSPTPVMFVDDFIGTGNQCKKAWNENVFYNFNTLEKTIMDGGHVCVYASLFSNESGYDRINNECKGLNLVVSHILGREYNLFSEKCICWKNDINLYKQGVNLIINTSKRLGIPDDNSEVSARGFGGQGLAIAIEIAPPDAVPAFFYWCQDDWKPLIRRSYTR